MYKVLVVDDEKDATEILSEMIRAEGFDTFLAQNAKEGLLILEKEYSSIVMVLSDAFMPEINGIEFRKKTLKKFKDIPFAIISGNITHEMALYAIDYNICGFVNKPITQKQLADLIHKKTIDRISNLEEKNILKQTFIEESTSIITELEPLILSLEQDPNNLQAINTIFRLVHTVKGASGILDDPSIKNYLHRFEDLLSKIKLDQMNLTEEVISVLLKAYDTMQQMIKNLSSDIQNKFDVESLVKIFDLPKNILPYANEKKEDDLYKKDLYPNNQSKKENKITVTSDLLDDLLEKSGETTVLRNMINKIVISIGKEIPSHKSISLLSSLLDEMHKINSVTQSKIANLRKISLKNILRPVPRIIRETAKTLGKKVNLHVENIDILLETSIGQVFSESVVHIIRNAIDHGIETEEIRLKSNKKKDGTIKIVAREENGFVYIDIQDDGRGIDPKIIKNKIIEKKLASKEEVENFSQGQILSYIFHSGFSTAEKITDISGRGVGMDMVQSSVQAKGGSIVIDSHIGKGTTFKIKIPIPKSVIIINSILIKIGEEVFSVPQSDVDRILHIDESKIESCVKKIGSSLMILHGDELVPIIDLHEFLNLKNDNKKLHRDYLLISKNEKKYALFVSSIVDTEEIVVKEVFYLKNYPYYKGATFTDDGKVALILNPEFFISKNDEQPAHSNLFQNENHLIFEEENKESIVIFKSLQESYHAIRLEHVFRLECFKEDAIKVSMFKKNIIYRDTILNLIDFKDVFFEKKINLTDNKKNEKDTHTIIIKNNGVLSGLIVDEIVEIKEIKISFKNVPKSSIFVEGCMIINEKITNFIDIEKIIESENITKKIFLKDEKLSQNCLDKK